MNAPNLAAQIVRYDELIPCRTAFIDARTPGSDQKENFCIIGSGVSESSDQHVHIKTTPGFNIGAAGQPPGCKNSLHFHHTAEVFFVLHGRWRFFWGLHGDAGEVVLEEGDIFNIPTHIFRGFENVGTDYGMIMSILGGDDAGGGVVWAPHVIKAAAAHGLILGEDGRLYDSQEGEPLPDGISPMPLLSDAALKRCPEPTTDTIAPRFVARYADLLAQSAQQPCKVIGADALINDRPGFEVDFLSHNTPCEGWVDDQQHHVLMIMRGQWRLDQQTETQMLSIGDTCAVPPGATYRIQPAGNTGTNPAEASLFRVRSTEDPAGATLIEEKQP